MSETNSNFNFLKYMEKFLGLGSEDCDEDDGVVIDSYKSKRFDIDAIRTYFKTRDNSISRECTSIFNALQDVTYAKFEDTVPHPKVVEVYDDNRGDGNEWEVVFELYNSDEPENKIFLKFEGWYSSWGESQMNCVTLSVPYEHTETRYRKAEMKL